MEAQLSAKEYLKHLELNWLSSNAYSSQEYEQLLEELKPHINLQTLRIYAYGGARPPLWMSNLSILNLRKLELCVCLRLSTLPALGKLPFLEHLTLSSLPEIKKLDHTFYGNNEGYSFPVLKELIFMCMKEWEEWVEVDGTALYPQLESLELHRCPKLRRLPTLPPSLRSLDISDVGIHNIPRICQSIGSGTPTKPSPLSFLINSNCEQSTSLQRYMLQKQENTPALTKLCITNCSELVHLPPRWSIDLKSLRELRIKQCPKLMIATGSHQNLLPSSLKNIYIEECGLEMPLLGSSRNLTSLKDLSLTKCSNLTSLPSAEVLSALTALSNLSINGCGVVFTGWARGFNISPELDYHGL
jgi:hypothetical protein